MANTLTHERYCAELDHQVRLFAEALTAAGDGALGHRVPTCPDWTLRHLTEHLGGALRWMGETVRSRASEMVPHDAVPGGSGPGEQAGAPELAEWFGEGARQLVDALRSAGPDAPVWTWSEDQSAAFWARRATHETVIHRADAFRTLDRLDRDFTVAPDLAADGLDEWLQIVCSPQARAHMTSLRKLNTRAGASLHAHPTDMPAPAEGEQPAEWLIEVADGSMAYTRAHAKADVAVRGPMTDLLLTFYRRRSPDHERLEVLGDRGLLDLWLESANFG